MDPVTGEEEPYNFGTKVQHDTYLKLHWKQLGYFYIEYNAGEGTIDKTNENEEYYDWAVGWPYDGLVSEYNTTSTGERYSWDVIFDFTLTLGDYEAPDTGYNYISDPKNGAYNDGDVFQLNLVQTTGPRKPSGAVSWYFDDEPASAQSVTLTTGSHVIGARFTTSEGKTKIVELELNVQ